MQLLEALSKMRELDAGDNAHTASILHELGMLHADESPRKATVFLEQAPAMQREIWPHQDHVDICESLRSLALFFAESEQWFYATANQHKFFKQEEFICFGH